MLDATHDPRLTSWVESAQDPASDFPIQNLPFGLFRRRAPARDGRLPRVGVAIGDCIVDIAQCHVLGLLPDDVAPAAESCIFPSLNELMALGADAVGALRAALVDFLRADSPEYRRNASVAEDVLLRIADAELFVPARVGDYSDFYASIDHARNIGSMFRPDNPLLPNYRYVPIGYHGRASSIVPSGTLITRPWGQIRDGDGPPTYSASRRMDYELEVGAFIGAGNALGEPIPIDGAERHVFGLCLVNDWSARDIQTWEYQPLGPFLAKSFATSVSPWVVTLAALEPFRAPALERPAGDPAPLPYLSSEENARRGGFDVTLEVHLRSARMRERGDAPMLVSRGSFTTMYWTVAQLVTHHASNGCNLQPGDLIASGTVSGPTPESRGCLLERTWRGTEPLTLPTGEKRSFLQDGDEVIMRGYCEREGFRRIGFGQCAGEVRSAVVED